MKIENIFIDMITKHIDDLRSGVMIKKKFLSMYISETIKCDRENAFRYKRPQVIGEGKEPTNNWLDYILEMNEEEYIFFRNTL